jgi:hypothetical protein
MSAPIRAEKPNFRTPWLEGSGGILDPYWQRIFTKQTDLINALAAQNEALAVKVAALEQYNIDHP